MCEAKKIFVALAGPVTNMIAIALIMCFKPFSERSNILIYINFLIAVFNLIPIYPLDGGRVLKGLLYVIFGNWKSKQYIADLSIIFMIFLTAISSVAIYYFKNIAILFMILYLWGLVINEYIVYKKKLKIFNLVKSIENN